jgi:hypothetical protein
MNIKLGDDSLDVLSYLFIGEQEINGERKACVSVCPSTPFTTALDLYATLGKQILDGYLISALKNPDNKLSESELKEKFYDAFNVYVSNVLAAFIPDKDLRPDMTMDAIMSKENEIIEEKYSHINREDRRKAARNIAREKKRLSKMS